MILPVIMAGGSGTRLWPLSRTLYPKQFLSLTSESTMLQDTLQRLEKVEHQPPFIICNESHRFIVAEQLRKANLKHSGILLEPVGRNTAPAVALAALYANRNNNDPLLLVLAADHVINNTDAFAESIKNAIHLANNNHLVTFGIVPDKPEVGYGYIKKGNEISSNAYQVDAFVEKPNLDKAQHYIEDGHYLWNSGMFMFKASVFLKELEKFRPDILSACKASLEMPETDLDFIRLHQDNFRNCPDDSIDYAVMEKTDSAIVIPLDANWSDVGSWSSLWDISNKDSSGNFVRGDVIIDSSSRSYVYSQHRLVAAVGVEDLIIVETKDALLVAQRDQVQKVKNIVSKLKQAERSEHIQHREVFRPWGSHDTIAEGDRYQVKHVVIKPGQKTAIQVHHHRAEHWVVVSGTAKVYYDEKTYLVAENESTFIPIGVAHAIENPGKIPLEIIEVRSGVYLEEDDVIRISSSGAGY
ncbi:mannose-1-phosphate guanylyltransferase/mannose-6-phosphate isomerase [Franconibacter pulveris]|uniref:mannose-1-phosphate guanylyltransferase/mannose-6-phosphate isomerase n=1 Tax=Franconibacter pulveris TaxID=435910 RepID=UPI0008FF6226|nr:mannose-1-phosphate guanylyltransferase/mannose-6-phosphate isomerase [Franconibacter pulveris]